MTRFEPPVDLLDALVTDLETAVGDGIGPLLGIAEEYVAMLSSLYDDAGAEDVDLETAEGADLEALAGVTGVFPLAPAFSQVQVTLTGVAGTPVPAGSQVATVFLPSGAEGRVAGLLANDILGFVVLDQLALAKPALTFETAETVELVEVRRVTPDVNDTLAVGELFTVLGTQITGWVFECTEAGNLGATNVLALTIAQGGDILAAAGTATFRTVGLGTAAAEVSAFSVEPSDIGVPVGALAELGSENGFDDVDAILTGVCAIVTAVSGWTGVLNRTIGAPGRLDEAADRMRDRAKVSAAHDRGNSYDPHGIEASSFRVPGIIATRVAIDDAAHTAGILVLGGDVDVIASGLHRLIPHSLALTTAFPATTETASVLRVDGQFRPISFQRPAALAIDIVATLVVDVGTYAGEPSVAALLAELSIASDARPRSRRLGFGVDVYASRIRCELLDVVGVLSVDFVSVNAGTVAAVADYQYGEIGTLTLTIQEST